MKKNKLVVIINGRGGVGKDTLCDVAKEEIGALSFSSIDPVKEVARKAGWKGEKTPEARRFLAKLKKLMIEYNDAPTKYLLEKYEEFKNSDSSMMFCHIREAEEIDKFKAKIVDNPCVTLLVRRFIDIKEWGNSADDEVENYSYDYIYDNNLELEKSKVKFMEYLRYMIDDME